MLASLQRYIGDSLRLKVNTQKSAVDRPWNRTFLGITFSRSGYRQLRRRGVDRFLAWNTAKSAHGPWRLSASPAIYRALPNRYFRDLGLPELAAR